MILSLYLLGLFLSRGLRKLNLQMVSTWLLIFLTGAFHILPGQDAQPVEPQRLLPPRNGGIYVVAHRGAHQGIPENSLAAYRRAIDLGCDFVEIDVRTTKDGTLVSIHDATIDRYVHDGRKGIVAEMTLSDLKSIDIGSRVDPKWCDERIPTVREVLELCRGKIGVYLDVKEAEIESLQNIIQEFDMNNHSLWYLAANRIQELKRISPNAWPMPDPGPQVFLAKLLEEHKPPLVASSWKFLSSTFADQCHEAKALVIVDEGGRESWKSMLEWGVDGIQTDWPEELIQTLQANN